MAMEPRSNAEAMEARSTADAMEAHSIAEEEMPSTASAGTWTEYKCKGKRRIKVKGAACHRRACCMGT